uniref:Peptidase S1 domain-containing protein n=1 Tax=Daphnia galeata TaxID=27404 RepID=A0A8J2RPU0_9CRUS|nr:unnamed protein product [Daphnia galeata]
MCKAHVPSSDCVIIIGIVLLLLSDSVVSNGVYVTDDSVIIEGAGVRYAASRLSSDIIIMAITRGRNNGHNPRQQLPIWNNLKTSAVTHRVCHYLEKDGGKVSEVCWRHPAGLNILSDGNVDGKILTMTQLLQSGFHHQMLLTSRSPQVKENAISASSRQSTCGAGPTKTSTVEADRVVGGSEAQPHSWPGIVTLSLDGNFRCGGTLISPTKILTAAHCVFGLWPWDASRLTIALGMHVREPSDAQEVKSVRKIAHHLLFSTSTAENDIAVLTLDSPVTYTSTISPVCLPPFGSNDQYAGQSASIVGWGLTSFQGSLPSALQQATTEIVSNGQCATSYSGIINIASSMLCATDPGIGSCNGDSGGPIFVRSSPGAPWIQVGIVSFGVECANDRYPSVYTRVSSHLPWIMKHMFF